MIRFYFHPKLNPARVELFLQEAGLPDQTTADQIHYKGSTYGLSQLMSWHP